VEAAASAREQTGPETAAVSLPEIACEVPKDEKN
jgi:hypothetical protein